MPNLNSVLKSEITRLARKEIKTAVDPLRKANATYRRDIAELKRQLAQLQRDAKTTARATRRTPVETQDDSTQRTPRFVAGGLKTLRARLGLSANDFGRLIGASGQSVYNWEAGKAVPRAGQRVALAGLRGLGKREALRRLEALG